MSLPRRRSHVRRRGNCIYACDGIAEAAVFGAPDERLGEVPVAVLYRQAIGRLPTPDEMVRMRALGIEDSDLDPNPDPDPDG